jgi:hypothetical protein
MQYMNNFSVIVNTVNTTLTQQSGLPAWLLNTFYQFSSFNHTWTYPPGQGGDPWCTPGFTTGTQLGWGTYSATFYGSSSQGRVFFNGVRHLGGIGPVCWTVDPATAGGVGLVLYWTWSSNCLCFPCATPDLSNGTQPPDFWLCQRPIVTFHLGLYVNGPLPPSSPPSTAFPGVVNMPIVGDSLTSTGAGVANPFYWSQPPGVSSPVWNSLFVGWTIHA